MDRSHDEQIRFEQDAGDGEADDAPRELAPV